MMEIVCAHENKIESYNHDIASDVSLSLSHKIAPKSQIDRRESKRRKKNRRQIYATFGERDCNIFGPGMEMKNELLRPCMACNEHPS